MAGTWVTFEEMQVGLQLAGLCQALSGACSQQSLHDLAEAQ